MSNFHLEDLKIGDRFKIEINEAIRHYDKLLLILSKNSIGSVWVVNEVKAALKIIKEIGIISNSD